MKRSTSISILLSVLSLYFCVSCAEDKPKNIATVEAVEQEEIVSQQEVHPIGFCPDTLAMKEGTVQKGQFFSNLLTSLGMSYSESYDLTQACDTIFDVRTLRVGNAYKAYFSEHQSDSPGTVSRLEYLVYDKDRMNQVVFDCQPPYAVWNYQKPIEYVERYADVTISSSLWNDMLAADISPLLILNLSDIYAWTIDFFGLQKGDRFKVLYQEKLCDGEVVAVDTVRYAVFSHGGTEFPAIMFDQKDGGNLWWNEKGESMRKAFLKAPLQYSRISSGFTYARKHPITRKVQPHTGVDYAAPTGTPVMTIGDGEVIERGYKGAGGNTVKIRHNSIYTTAYLHLSKYAAGLKVGDRVKQGDVIGYVGSTGRSTGPHLDFRVWKNGTPINPLTMDSPPAEPIGEDNMPAFNSVKGMYEAQIDAIKLKDSAVELFNLL
ncbi:MAG: metalloendopeptidase [Bacteroidales bacterium]|nr:metalloendopeptidase [Bacteroidales bacterium]